MSGSGGWAEGEDYADEGYGYDEDPDEAYEIVKAAIGSSATPAQIEAALEKVNWNSAKAIAALRKAAAAKVKTAATATASKPSGPAASAAVKGGPASATAAGAATKGSAAAAPSPAPAAGSAAAKAGPAVAAAPAPLPAVPAEILAYYGAAGRPAAVLRSSSAAAGGAGGLSRSPSTSVPASPLPGAAAACSDAAGAAKPRLSVVTIGHVDAGKSTLMGHLLASLGVVNPRQLAKLAKDAATAGKGSFAFAWVLDEGAAERERGVTVDVACNAFETARRSFTLLDAPGHRDFVPNTITAIAQADVAVLVIDASPGEFEMSISGGGQAAEHVLLARNLGIAQLVVAVNKMDGPLVRWSADRFFEIVDALALVLQTAGFKRENVAFVPVSGLTGVNLVKSAEALASEVAAAAASAAGSAAAGADGRAPSAPPAPSAGSARRAAGFAAGDVIRWDPALIGASAAARALVGGSGGSASAAGAGGKAAVGRAPSSAFDDDDEPRGRRGHGEPEEDLSDMLEGLGFDSAPATPAGDASAAAGAGSAGAGGSSRAAAAAGSTDTAVATALSGARAMSPVEIRLLAAWYSGPTLLGALEAVPLPPGLLEAPLRLSIADAYKGGFGGIGSGTMITGRIEGGYITPGAKLVVVPGMHSCAVKGILINGRPAPFAAAGDNVDVQVGGLDLDVTPVFAGAVLCWASHPIAMVSRFKAKIVTFPGLDMPVLPGQQFMLHSHAAEEPCNVTRLLRTLDREGHTKAIKPRALGPSTIAVVRVALPRPIPLETFAQHPRLGRFVLRYGGQTIAAGMILKAKA